MSPKIARSRSRLSNLKASFLLSFPEAQLSAHRHLRYNSGCRQSSNSGKSDVELNQLVHVAFKEHHWLWKPAKEGSRPGRNLDVLVLVGIKQQVLFHSAPNVFRHHFVIRFRAGEERKSMESATKPTRSCQSVRNDTNEPSRESRSSSSSKSLHIFQGHRRSQTVPPSHPRPPSTEQRYTSLQQIHSLRVQCCAGISRKRRQRREVVLVKDFDSDGGTSAVGRSARINSTRGSSSPLCSHCRILSCHVRRRIGYGGTKIDVSSLLPAKKGDSHVKQDWK